MTEHKKITAEMVRNYQEEWANSPGYPRQENILDEYFHKKYKENKNPNEVLIKVILLDKFYSTHLDFIDVLPLVERITDAELNFDERLRNKDISLVDAIRKCTGTKDYYSFATKYCSHHDEDTYPIYDQFVAKSLREIQAEKSFNFDKNNKGILA